MEEQTTEAFKALLNVLDNHLKKKVKNNTVKDTKTVEEQIARVEELKRQLFGVEMRLKELNRQRNELSKKTNLTELKIIQLKEEKIQMEFKSFLEKQQKLSDYSREYLLNHFRGLAENLKKYKNFRKYIDSGFNMNKNVKDACVNTIDSFKPNDSEISLAPIRQEIRVLKNEMCLKKCTEEEANSFSYGQILIEETVKEKTIDNLYITDSELSADIWSFATTATSSITDVNLGSTASENMSEEIPPNKINESKNTEVL